MGYVKTASGRVLALVLAALMALVVAAGITALPQNADAAVNDKVLEQRNGVFKFNWGIDGREIARGSAFLINEDTIITAYHCVMPGALELEYYGYTVQDVQDRSTYTITLTGGFQVGATLEKVSEEQDTAILKLDNKLNDVHPLTLRDSSDVDASEQVYALGFPGTADKNAVITFTSNDVAVIDGTVSKPEGQMNFIEANSGVACEGSFLMSTCRMEGGTSGGPMVDNEGNVIGVCVAADNSFYYASASDVLITALKQMNYDFNVADPIDPVDPGDVVTIPELNKTALQKAIADAKAVDPAQFTDESYAAVTAALAEAEKAAGTELSEGATEEDAQKAQKTIDDNANALTAAVKGLQEKPKGLPMEAIIGIVAGVVVVIAIIVVIFIMRGRKKKAAAAAAAGANPYQQPQMPVGAAPQVLPTAAPSADSAETTLFDEEAPDTVMLFQAASGGSLTRMSTNEQIPINCADFSIGRERSKVNYCLEGNTSISRVHARIVVRDGKVYLIDNKAANGTFVNGVKARPGQEILLKNGDVITLADEKFKYNS